MISKYVLAGISVLVINLLIQTTSYGQNTPNDMPESHVIEVEKGVNLHIVDWGGTGPPMLFVPSWASTSHIFDRFAPVFTDSFHVLVMNKRGHGPSSRPDHGYTIERLTKDMEVVLDSLNIDKVILIGLSRAESLTTQFASIYTDRVSGLIYLSGPIDREYDRNFISQPENRRAAILRSNTDDEILALCGIDNTRIFPPGTDDDAANELGREWRNADPSPPYSDITVPALAFWSPITSMALQYQMMCQDVEDQDLVNSLIERFIESSIPFYEKQARDMAIFNQEMENGKIVIIPGSDYNTFLTHPGLVEAQIRSFLEANGIN